MKNILIKCPDGFANQLRLSLASNLLVKENKADVATQEWILNNHNIVDFHKFFYDLDFLTFEQISDQKAIETASFTALAGLLCDKKQSIEDIFREAFSHLVLKEPYQTQFSDFIKKFHIEQCIGLHVRTGCKTALLLQARDRHKPIPLSKVIAFLNTNNQRIFLATDNKETQDMFIDLFKDRILFYEKLTKGTENFNSKYDRTLVKRYSSDLHVVADFYILQKCKYFIGSNESSFSLMIKYIRNNEQDFSVKGIL